MSGPTFQLSEFQLIRQKFIPILPHGLQEPNSTFSRQQLPVRPEIKAKFPHISAIQYVEFQPTDQAPQLPSPLKIGCVLSGGQASGGHNVIMGLFDYIKRLHSSSQLFGFLGGPRGIYENKYMQIDQELMKAYRNQGGFDMICSGRDKIDTPERFENSVNYCKALNLDGLVVIGGDDSNTNAALLAQYFLENNCSTKVIGCPKTIDGDLKNEYIQISFGFDTATKTYSESIGNICLDALSSKKYYHFIRLMGRSASHIALECELQTRANLVLIGEEVKAKNQTLQEIVNQVADMIMKRAEHGKQYGVILVPEGLIEFIPQMNELISQLNSMLAGKKGSTEQLEAFALQNLSANNKQVFTFLPEQIRHQLLLDRDPHGNVQVAKIDTQRLLILQLYPQLARRNYPLQFLPQSYYFGYQGRSCLPSNFDASYCYALGNTAAGLIRYGFTGCMAVCRGLHLPPQQWESAGCPLATMMNMETRGNKQVPVIEKALVRLDGSMFKAYEAVRELWMVNDCYVSPGPIQFEGPGSDATNFMIVDATTEMLESLPDSQAGQPYFKRTQYHMSEVAKARIQVKEKMPLVFDSSLGSNLYCVKMGDVIEPDTEQTKAAVQEEFVYLNQVDHKRFAQVVESNQVSGIGLRIGVVCLGRQAPGVHNVIDGLLKILSTRPNSVLFGFLGGNKGVLNREFFIINEQNFYYYRNTGGIDFLGRATDCLRSAQHLATVKQTCLHLSLDGLVIIGASHSMTDTAKIANYFLQEGVPTKVIGVPCAIDNNLYHHLFETTIGFDTASRVNAQLIGNMMTDAASATKYFYFMRLMGKDPSHLSLECALQTHPNLVLISELYKREGISLPQIVEEIADIIQARANQKKFFGTLLVPEGLLTYLAHFHQLFNQIGDLMLGKTKHERDSFAEQLVGNPNAIDTHFHNYTAPVLKSLPTWFQHQLLTRIDANGHILMSLIETERLLADMVGSILKTRGVAFAPVCHFFGYQGRCSMPTAFDCSLASTYGATAGALIAAGLTGYMTTARGLTSSADRWRVGGIPLTAMMKVKGTSLYGRNKALVPSADVDLHGKAYQYLAANMKVWQFGDHYTNPGPIQFFSDAKYLVNLTLTHDHKQYLELLENVSEVCDRIREICRFGVHEDLLRTAVIGLSSVEGILNLHKNV